METHKLKSIEGFVLVDMPDAEMSVGPVRLGTKLMPSLATNHARELTYAFASLGQKRGGMTIGLKVAAESRLTAVESVAVELDEALASGRFVVDPGLRMAREQLGALAAHDPRNPVLLLDRDGVSLADELIGLGAVCIAEQLVGLASKFVAIEGLSSGGIAIAREVEAVGGSVGRVSTAKGSVSGSFTAAALQAALDEHGDDAPAALGEVEKPWKIWGSDGIDAIFCGSSPGILSAAGAPAVGSTAVIATGVAPIATKALAVLNSAGAPTSPAFLAALGMLEVAFDTDVQSADEARSLTVSTVDAVCGEVARSEAGIYVGACRRAEAYMASWAETQPFGRPMN